jgi:tetratricopeptide (TPR) repeat protein
MHELALAYGGAGRKEKSWPLAEEMLALQKRQFGATHTNTLVAMHNVALLFQRQQQLDKAMPLFEEALAGMRTKLPPLHPDRLNTTATLAQAYYSAEQIDKAIALSEGVLPQFKTAYGAADAKTVFVHDRLFGYYVDVGSCDKAETLLNAWPGSGTKRPGGVTPPVDPVEKRRRDFFRRIKPAAEKYQNELAHKGADHPDTLAARQAFAAALGMLKRNGAAAYHLKALLDTRQRLMLAEAFDTQICRLELGTIRLQQRDFAKAEPLLLEAYAGLKQHEIKIAGEAKGRVVEALQRLVQLYDGWNKKDKATEWRQTLESQKK